MNRKLGKDGISAFDTKTDQYLQSLTLALQLFLQETADKAEIAVSSLLSRLSEVGRDVQRMEEDQQDAQNRVQDVLISYHRINALDDDPKETLRQVNEAEEKIQLIRRALSRRNK